MTTDLDFAIIGAGPYGLSLAAHLNQRGVRYRVFGQLMHSWSERMPRGMSLKSDPFASNLYDPEARFTLEAYQKEQGRDYTPTGWRVPLETFVDYGRWFQERTVADLDPRMVTAVEPARGGFRLVVADQDEVFARRVAVCAGISHFARLPEQLRELSPHLVSHSSEHNDPTRFKGRDVTVLGAGASALDLAMLMQEAGATVRLVARAAAAKFSSDGGGRRSLVARLRQPRSGLGAGWSTYIVAHHPGAFQFLPDRTRTWAVRQILGPAAGPGVRERMEGRVDMLMGHRIVSVAPKNDFLVLRLAGPEGEREIATEHLVAATGYLPDLDRLEFLSPALRQIRRIERSPRLNGSFESSVPNLFFAGLAAANTFGPLQRFAFGARFAALRIAARAGASASNRNVNSLFGLAA